MCKALQLKNKAHISSWKKARGDGLWVGWPLTSNLRGGRALVEGRSADYGLGGHPGSCLLKELTQIGYFIGKKKPLTLDQLVHICTKHRGRGVLGLSSWTLCCLLSPSSRASGWPEQQRRHPLFIERVLGQVLQKQTLSLRLVCK